MKKTKKSLGGTQIHCAVYTAPARLDAMKQASKDIREDLRREGKTYITASLKQLRLKRIYEMEEV